MPAPKKPSPEHELAIENEDDGEVVVKSFVSVVVPFVADNSKLTNVVTDERKLFVLSSHSQRFRNINTNTNPTNQTSTHPIPDSKFYGEVKINEIILS